VSTPVLATKLFPPAQRLRLVARPRVTGQLDATLDAGHRLTLVSAPAGFGKSTVLSDWVAHVAQRQPHVRVGWLSLDDADNDLARLMTYLVACLNGAGLGIDPAVLESLHTSSATALTALINDVTRAGDSEPVEEWVVVLDDYHAINAPEVHEALAFLLDHLPDHLHLMLATRSDPPLPLARLRSREQLTEIRAADLRLNTPEAQEFLNRTMGLDLTADHVHALEERTEGWIAGLQLAALSLRGVPEPSEVAGFIEAFTGSNRFVIDYLADEVLARQPGRVRDFLLETAILERLTGPLCDAVTGETDGARMLEELERGNLFLAPLDTERIWYRYHHLFADVLHARLRAEAPDQVPRLHRRASDWYAAHEFVEDAVRHALAAEDFDRAAHLMEEALPGLRRTRQDGLLLAWARSSLPEPVVRRSPVLSILSGWSLMMSGDLDGLESRLDDAEAALAAGAHDQDLAAAWTNTDDLRTAPATISVYRASLAQARGDVAGTVRHARHALALAEPQDHFVRGAGSGFLGLAAWATGDVREALSTFGEAVRCLHAAGNFVDELDGTIVLADLWVTSGSPSRARRLCEQALQTAAHGGHPYLRATADLHVALAELDRELDDLTTAEEHLETARILGERISITENRHRWFVAKSQVRAADGDFDTALGLLDQAEELYRHGFYPDVRPIAAMKARLRIAAGDLASAAAWAEDRGVGVADEADYLREYEHLTLARLLIAQHRGEQHSAHARSASLGAVLDLLDRLHTAAADAGRDGSLLEIRVLQALAHHAHGDLPSALDALSLAMGEAPEPDSYVRLYLEEGGPMTALLNQAVSATDPPAGAERGEALRGRARRLLELAQTVQGTQAPQSQVEPLSRREVEVLRLLDSDLTGPEIARELYITVNTLRTHTKRIFTKLDAKTRAVAVHRARERGLL